MKKKVLILGGSRYYIKSIQAAKNEGYQTLVIDKNPWSPGFEYADEYEVIDICDHKTALEYSRKKNIDGIAAINDYGVYTAAYVAAYMNLPGIDLSIAETAINKAELRKKWEEKGQPNPRFEIVTSLKQCKYACKTIGFPVIFKPSVSTGGGSRGVIYIDDYDNIEAGYRFSTSFYEDKTILVEEFLDGVEHSAEVLFYRGKGYLLAVSDKIKTPLPARVDKNVIYPTKFSGEQRKRLEKTIIEAVESLGMENGCGHVECCTLPSGEIKLFELGARPGGGGTPDPIVTFLTGVNEFKQYLKICVGDEPDTLSPIFEKGCNYHFIMPRPGKIKSINGFNDILEWENILDANLFIKKGDIIKDVKIGPDRSGFIIAGGDSREEAISLADKAERYISIDYQD